MGIDIYAQWRGQEEEEKQKQYTGFSVTAGDCGYLREAYHGGPYVTRYLLAEAFASETASAKIPASVLRERLPTAVLMSLYREKTVYGKDSKSNTFTDTAEFLEALKDVFETKMDYSDNETFIATLTPLHLSYGENLIKNKLLPDYAQSFVDFVELCEKKEQEKGEPCEIIASY